jgi:hypothetical protein
MYQEHKALTQIVRRAELVKLGNKCFGFLFQQSLWKNNYRITAKLGYKSEG